MACFIKYDTSGNIISFGSMSKANVDIQKLPTNIHIAEVDGMEKGFDSKYKVKLDDENKPIINMTGKAQLERRFDCGVPMTEKESLELNK